MPIRHRLSVCLALAILSCGDDPSAVTTPPPDPPVPTTISITPESVVFTAIGDTARLTAQVRDQNGNAMTGATVSWASTDPSVASVTGSGLARAAGDGTATITAVAGSAADSAGVSVRRDVAQVAVTPSTVDIEVGDTLRLTAEAQDSNGNPVEWTEFIWASGTEHVATVDSTGLVQARVRGDATMTARAGAITGSAELAVHLPLIPPNFAVDQGTSHSLQFAGIYVDHVNLRQNPREYDYPAAIAYLDFNGDGHVDVFHSTSSGSMDRQPAQVYLGDGVGGFDYAPAFFGDHPGGIAPRKALPGDFNGDGKPDVFVVDHGYDHRPFPGAPAYALLSSDSGYVKAVGLDEIIGFQHGGASADIDADGDLDVVVTNGYGFDAPFFFVNDGTGGFVWDTTRIDGITEAIYTAELVDVDLDGYVDLLVAGHEYEGFPTQVLWGDNSGVFSTAKATILPEIPGHGIVVDIDVADTDADGDKDVVVNRTGDDTGEGWYIGYRLQLLEQTAPRSFVDMTEHLVHQNDSVNAGWIVWLRIFDIDGDGDPDLLDDDRARHLIWKNDGSGQFRRGSFAIVPPNPSVDEGTSHSLQNPPFSIDHSAVRSGRPGWADAIAYGDFDQDGDTDIFYAPRHDPPRHLPAELYINHGGREFSLDTGFMDGHPPRLASPTKALPGDFNGDGRLDIFVTAAQHGGPAESPYVILSSGGGEYTRTVDVAMGHNTAATSADVDADGDLDVIVSDPPSVLFNDGNGSFRRGRSAEGIQVDVQLNQFLTAAELVDVDIDGYVDLLVGGHEHESPTQILWGDSTGLYSTGGRSMTIPAVGGHGVIRDIDVADVDADGDRDIVVSRTGDDQGGVGFYEGYYVQLVENLGDRRFRDASTLVLENRDDQANPFRWARLYDVDGDLDIDIVVDGRVGLVWKNDGTGHFRREF